MNKIILALFIVFANYIHGQTIQDLGLQTTTLNNPYSMIKVGNFIYYTNSSPTASGYVRKFDCTIPNPQSSTVNAVTSGFSFLTGIAHYNGFLYVAANNAIWKLDLAQTNPIPQVYYYNDTGTTTFYTKNVFSLCVIGNDLFFNSSIYSGSSVSSKILKVNLLDPIPNPIILQNNIPYAIGSLVNVGNNMYFSTLNSGNGVAICKFDITNPAAGVSSVINNENGYICKIAYYKNRIFFPNETSGTVKSFDPQETTPIVRQEFNLSRAAGLLGVDCDLYAGTTASTTTNKLVKVRIPFVTGNAVQSFDFTIPSEITIEDLVINGSNISWFNSLSDANSNNNPIAPNTQLIQGNTYYAVATDGLCRSFPFAVTTSVLSNEDFNFSKFKFYPNPTKDILNIDFNEMISDTEILISNIQGQIIQKIKVESISKLEIKIPEICGVYFIQIKSRKINKTFKIIKE